MNSDKTYQLLISKMHEVSTLPTQEVGRFTPVYKKVVPYFKYAPWKSVVFASALLSASLYLVFGLKLVRLASILQYGF